MNSVLVQQGTDLQQSQRQNDQANNIRKSQKNKSMFSCKMCSCNKNQDSQIQNVINLKGLSQSSIDSNSSPTSFQTNQKNDFSLGDSLSKAFFNFFPEGVAFIDNQMNLFYANDSLYKFFQSDQFDLLEKLFYLKNDLSVNELQKQKSEKAQNFIINNIVRTDQHIATPKQKFNIKMKSQCNIKQQELPSSSRKYSALPFKNNQTQNNIVIPNLQMSIGSPPPLIGKYRSQQYQQKVFTSSLQNHISSNTPVSKNPVQNQNAYCSTPPNNEGSLQQISQFANYILQSNTNTPVIRQKSNTSLPMNTFQKNNYSQSNIVSNNQFSYGSKRNIQDELTIIPPVQANHKFTFNQNNSTNDECMFNAHYPVQDSMSHSNIQKKQAISPNLQQEIELILQEANQYMLMNQVDVDCILDKSFTFTSRIVFSDSQKQGSIVNNGFFSSHYIHQNQQQSNVFKKQQIQQYDKQMQEDLIRQKQISIEPLHLQQQQPSQIYSHLQSQIKKNNSLSRKSSFNIQSQVTNQNNLNQNLIHLASQNKESLSESKELKKVISQITEDPSSVLMPEIDFSKSLSSSSKKIKQETKTCPKIGNNAFDKQSQNGFSPIDKTELRPTSSFKEQEDQLKSDSINTTEKDETIIQINLDENGYNTEGEYNNQSHLQLQGSPTSIYQMNIFTQQDKNCSLTAIHNINQKSQCSISYQQQHQSIQQQNQSQNKKFSNTLHPYQIQQQSQQQQQNQYLSQQQQQTNDSPKIQLQIIQNEQVCQEKSNYSTSPNWISDSQNNTSLNYNNNNNFSLNFNKVTTPDTPPITNINNDNFIHNKDLLRYTNQSKQNINFSNNNQNIYYKQQPAQKTDLFNLSPSLPYKKSILYLKKKNTNDHIPEDPEKSERNDIEWSEEDDRMKNAREVDITIFAYIINQSPVILLLVRDVTHRSYIKLLQDVSKKKSKMVSFVSHELRTPLNSIIAMLETMKNKPDIDYIETALMNSKYLLCISNDLLDLAQIKVNKFQIKKKTFNLKELIMEAMEMFQIQAQRQQIELNVDYSPEIRQFITSDKNRIRQVLINLIGNAFKFTLTGSITIKVEKMNQTLFQVIVSDTGIGIKEGDLNKLFKTFGKLDGEESVKLNEQGVGLGLVISNMIAFSLSEEKEGLTVSSEYSKGSNFKFKILDLNITQSEISEEQLIAQIIEEEEDARMSVVAEEDEEKNVIKNMQQYNNFSLCKNKFFEGKRVKRKTKKKITTIYQSSAESLPSPIKVEQKSSRCISPLKQSNTYEFKSPSLITSQRTPVRLLTDFQNIWQEKRRNKLQLKKAGDTKQDYNILTINSNSNSKSPTDYSQPKNKLTKIATQINIKDEWGQILIVDDNMSNILAMKCLINSINPDLLCNYAIRGQGAEDLVKNRFNQQRDSGYSIIFMDIVMPEQDGITTGHKIKQFLIENQITQTKIIACSGYDDEQEKKKCLEVGMIDYLVKPVFKEKLSNVINMYLK